MGVMREPTFLILAAVVPMPLHGYGIIQAVADLSAGRVRLRAGTLYAALDRLVGEGSLVVDREEVVDGRLRRYYRITGAGLDALRRGVEHLEANASAARASSHCAPTGGRRDPRTPLPTPDPPVPRRVAHATRTRSSARCSARLGPRLGLAGRGRRPRARRWSSGSGPGRRAGAGPQAGDRPAGRDRGCGRRRGRGWCWSG